MSNWDALTGVCNSLRCGAISNCLSNMETELKYGLIIASHYKKTLQMSAAFQFQSLEDLAFGKSSDQRFRIRNKPHMPAICLQNQNPSGGGELITPPGAGACSSPTLGAGAGSSSPWGSIPTSKQRWCRIASTALDFSMIPPDPI